MNANRLTDQEACAIAVRQARARARRTGPRHFPVFRIGMTTVEYIALFQIGKEILPIDLGALGARAAPYLTGPEVVDESFRLDLA